MELWEAELLDFLTLINVVPGITELWLENYLKINCRNVTSIREGRVFNLMTYISPNSEALKVKT